MLRSIASTRRAFRLAGVAIMMFAGCADSSELRVSSLCQSDADCPADLLCDFSYCVAPGANQQALNLRITPPATSGLLSQQVPGVNFNDGPDRLVQLLKPTIITGIIVPRDDGLATNVPGTLTVEAPGDIPGMKHRFSAQSLAGLSDQHVGYSLAVLPGRRYEGTFRPDDRALPPHRFVMEPEDVDGGVFDITLPARDAYLHVVGRVRTSDYIPIGAASVIAHDDEGAVWGTTQTETVRGQFELLLPPSLTQVRFKVKAPGDGPLFPDFLTPLSPVAASGETLDVTIPPLPAGIEAFTAAITVMGRDTEGAEEPVTGTTITLIGDLAGGTLRRTAITDETGTAYIEALPGAYECVVATSTDQRYGSWHGRLDLVKPAPTGSESESQSPPMIWLDERLSLYGAVRDFIGLPIADGEIEATRRVQRAEGDQLAIAPTPFRGVIVSGEFHLRVDPGYYDIRVVPSTASGAPPTTLRDQDVTAGKSMELLLPRPGLAHITVAAPDGSYVGNATVEIFEVEIFEVEPVDGDVGADAGAESNDVAPPFLLTRGNTGDSGYIDLLIPHANIPPE